MALETIEKLKILSDDSRYDLACACGTREDEHRKRGPEGRWLYPVALPQGGYTVLLKTLLSNACANDCGYCPLRMDSDVRRCTLQPEEVARVFMEYIRRKKVFGLFLSSAVLGSPDQTMEKINCVARILRSRHEFRGYIHLKIIPGASDAAIEDAMSLATAVSLNIEVPGKRHFDLLSQKKDYFRDIVRPLKVMGRLTEKGGRHGKVKCTTQFIVGAADETDNEIVRSVFGLYDRLRFHRVYFSAYQKGLGRSGIPGEARKEETERPFLREHRLYQTEFLIRRYGFTADDVLFGSNGNLRLDKDPKQVWADAHPSFYPIRANTAEKDALLKVPGIGPETARAIIRARGVRRLSRIEDVGVKGRRAETVGRYVIFE